MEKRWFLWMTRTALRQWRQWQKLCESPWNATCIPSNSSFILLARGGAASRKSKWGRVINPNPPAIAARLAPGSGPAPLGRHFKDRRGQVVKHIALLDLFLFHFSLFYKCSHTGGSDARWRGDCCRQTPSVPEEAPTQFETCHWR